MNYALLADALVAVHLGIVVFILAGELCVVVGGLAGWQWVRNFLFRVVHLFLIVFVAVQGSFDRLCPLTTWENDLRVRAGQKGHEGSFVGRILHDVLFVDVPQKTLNVVYIGFAAIVVLSLFLVPPRRRRGAEPTAPR